MDVNKRCHKTCAVLGCQSSKKRMYQFPCLLKDTDRCLKWIAACGREDFLQLSPSKLRRRVVCDLHFESRHHLRIKLSKNTVPSCNLPAPVAPVKPQEEAVVEITEEEEHQPVLTIGSQNHVGLEDNVGLQDSMGLQDKVGLQDNVGLGTSRDSGTLAYNDMLPGSSRDCAFQRGELQPANRICLKGNILQTIRSSAMEEPRMKAIYNAVAAILKAKHVIPAKIAKIK